MAKRDESSYICIPPFDNGASYLELGTTYQTSRATRGTENEALLGLRLNKTQVETDSGAVLTELQYDVWQLEIAYMQSNIPRRAHSLGAKANWIRKHPTLKKYGLLQRQVIGILLEVSEIIAIQERYLDS